MKVCSFLKDSNLEPLRGGGQRGGTYVFARSRGSRTCISRRSWVRNWGVMGRLVFDHNDIPPETRVSVRIFFFLAGGAGSPLSVGVHSCPSAGSPRASACFPDRGRPRECGGAPGGQIGDIQR